MPETLPAPQAPPTPAPASGRTILIVDDSPLQRRMLGAQLEGWGYRTQPAGCVAEALAHLEEDADGAPRIVISDLDMPGGSGLDLCRAIRARGGRYVWFVLLTAVRDLRRRIDGLEAGADDFLAKPVASEELRARIAAGERVLDMEERLAAERARLAETLAERDRLAALVERDLTEGRRLQRSLMPDPEARYGPLTLSVALRSSGQVGGDLVGHFPTGAGRVGFYGLDVSGHGIASALMTARLKGFLSDLGGENVAVMRLDERTALGRPPALVAQRLNALTLKEMRTDHYFTFFYGELDWSSGDLRYVQAGHPGPVLLRASGDVETFGAGGLPVGLVDAAEWEEGTLRLGPGDRLLVHSDGFSECEGPDGMLGEEGLMDLVCTHRARRGRAFLRALVAGTMDWARPEGLQDDVSALMLEWDAPLARGDAPGDGAPGAGGSDGAADDWEGR